MRHILHRERFMLAFMFCLVAAGCSSVTQLQGPEQAPVPAGLARPSVSQLVAPSGTQIAVAIELLPGSPVLAGLQGDLRFDPAKLSYVGQAPYDTLGFPLVIVNDAFAPQGLLRIISLDPKGLESFSAHLVFDVRASDYAGTLRYSTVQGLDLALTPEPVNSTPVPADANAALSLPAGALRMTAQEWMRLERKLAPAGASRLIDSIPAGQRYGDVDSNGSINLLDAVRVLS